MRNRFGARDARGKRRPMTEDEKRRIVYFLRHTEEASLDVAARRFQRDPNTLRRIGKAAGVNMEKFRHL